MTKAPPPDWNAFDWGETQELRARPGWFGFAIIEQLWVHRDGSKAWRRIEFPTSIAKGKLP